MSLDIFALLMIDPSTHAQGRSFEGGKKIFTNFSLSNIRLTMHKGSRSCLLVGVKVDHAHGVYTSGLQLSGHAESCGFAIAGVSSW